MNILGIETSCDETAAAVVADGSHVLSNVVHSQADLHAVFGGVVPEVACRAHTDVITAVVERALDEWGRRSEELHGVAATHRPGLIGSLLVGVTAGKMLALTWGLPFRGVDHVHAHVYSARMTPQPPAYPYLCLVASGGHTALYLARSPAANELLGGTTDDAAGEAFDKVSALLGLGYPGGPAIQHAARDGDPNAVRFPRPLLDDPRPRFSFSGLKTAVLYHARGRNAAKWTGGVRQGVCVADAAASFQEAVVDVLATKTLRTAQRLGVPRVAVTGGVSASARLREVMTARARESGIAVTFPPLDLCTDNAAMIAGLGCHLLAGGEASDLDLEAEPNDQGGRMKAEG